MINCSMSYYYFLHFYRYEKIYSEWGKNKLSCYRFLFFSYNYIVLSNVYWKKTEKQQSYKYAYINL
jgi:hypothetical protein